MLSFFTLPLIQLFFFPPNYREVPSLPLSRYLHLALKCPIDSTALIQTHVLFSHCFIFRLQHLTTESPCSGLLCPFPQAKPPSTSQHSSEVFPHLTSFWVFVSVSFLVVVTVVLLFFFLFVFVFLSGRQISNVNSKDPFLTKPFPQLSQKYTFPIRFKTRKNKYDTHIQYN